MKKHVVWWNFKNIILKKGKFLRPLGLLGPPDHIHTDNGIGHPILDSHGTMRAGIGCPCVYFKRLSFVVLKNFQFNVSLSFMLYVLCHNSAIFYNIEYKDHSLLHI